ncbi:Protein ssh4 [Epichloe festucae Fl1]|uniref:Protein SSH4 n=1 Tax=Epichloe festucae (strain Fl1) TaxID=877507 RepID=A0A7S9KL37_EPIFF|nr:Protein ssh4 [Epichloe festucae Fl1]
MTLTEPPSSAFTGVIIGLVSSFGSIVLIALVVFIFWASGCAGSGRIILDRLGRPGEYDDEQAFVREEAEALETMDDMTRTEYLRAKAFVAANPPESLPTDISLSQYLAIQEKGVSAWEFEPELEVANCFVEGRTEIEFFDSECTVMSNLPVPKQNDVYYWEAKIYEKPENTLLSIGMGTKPYPLFRLPGYHKYSVAYFSDGSRHYNQPFSSTPYGPRLVQGDVIGVGYRPRTGAIFFTRNGKRYEEVVHGLKSQNFFPAIGATGPAIVHVNLGQSGFVFIEANVKKWGLAPVTGSLAPPPPYGSEQGSILLETGTKDGMTSGQGRPHRQSVSGSPYNVGPRSNHFTPGHGRTWSGNFRSLPPTSPGPVRSPTDISLAQLVPNDDGGEASGSIETSNTRHQEEYHDENPLHLHLEDATNPPPEYAGLTHSGSGENRRYSTDTEETPLIDVMIRSRGDSLTTTPRAQSANEHPHQQPHSPVPSYSDAVREGAGTQRRASSESESSDSTS